MRGRVVGGLISVASVALALIPVQAWAESISPTSVDFGTVTLGTTASQTVNVTLDSGYQVGNEIVGAPFSFLPGGTCGGGFTGPGTCTMVLGFTPQQTAAVSGQLTFDECAASAGCAIHKSVPLMGSGVSQFAASPSAIDFGSVDLQTSKSQTITFTVDAGKTFGIPSGGKPANNPPWDFGPGSTCLSSGTGGFFTGPGTCTLVETFFPPAPGPYSATLGVQECGGGVCLPLHIPLSGSGVSVAAVSPTNVDFGAVPLGSTASQTITVTLDSGYQTGNEIIGAPFKFLPGGTCGGGFTGPGTCTFVVGFTPQSRAPVTGTLRFDNCTTTAGAGCPIHQTVQLTGTGGTPVATLSATSVDFGAVRVGSTQASSVTVTNTGTAPLVIDSITPGGTNASEFSADQGCVATPVPVNGACTINLGFAPGAQGARSATVTITSNAANSPTTVALTGSGAEAIIGDSPTSVDFGVVPRGTTATVGVVITNSGNADLHISRLSVAGDPAFSAGSTAPVVVGAGQQVSIPVLFAPPGSATSAGPLTGTLILTSDAFNSPSLSTPLTGSVGIPVASLSPTSIDFGNAAVGSPVTKTLTVTNTGTAPLSVTGTSSSGTNASDFSASGCPSPVAANGGTCALTLTFAPSAAGARSGTINVVSNGLVSPIPISVHGSAFYLHGSSFGTMVNANGGLASLLFLLINQHLAPTPAVTAPTSGGTVTQLVARAYDNPYTDDYNLVAGATATAGSSISVGSTVTTGAVNIFDDVFAQATSTKCSATPAGVTGNATISGLRVDGVTYSALNWPFKPNDYLITNGGKLVINEQINNADGTITINALHLYVNNVTYGNSGDVIVGHVNCGINTAQ